MLSQTQCKMARAALNLGVRELAELADVSPNTVSRLERGERMHPRTLEYLRGVLEVSGIIFVDAAELSAWGGEGVRHYDTANVTTRMARIIQAFQTLRDIRKNPAETYETLVDIFEQIIEMLRTDDREPDDWESDHLNWAATALNASTLPFATNELWLAIHPPDDRDDDYPTSNAASNEVQNCSLAYFESAVRALRARGYIPRGG